MTQATRRDAPRISVIVPIYNVAGHVRACINSLKAQTLTDFDVLMIDDGATDGSGDIAVEAAAGDPRFVLIRQHNKGLSGARNAGLEAATGELIAFVDSDDRVMPDYLMRLWQVLEEMGGDWVACAIQSAEPDGSGSRHSAIHGDPDLSRHVVPRRYALDTWSDVIRHFPSAWNKLYRRSLIDGLRFDEGTWFEDHGFFHRVAARTDNIIHLPEALYIQTRGRADQITAQDDERVFDQFDVLAQIQRFFDSSPRPGGRVALAQIASRLMYERSTVLADPTRRAHFARASHDFLQENGLNYSSDWDSEIGLSWGMEMAEELPLSVILSWDGDDLAGLHRSLDALRSQTAPGHEVLIMCQTQAAQRILTDNGCDMPTHWKVLLSPQAAEGAAFNHGLAHARGAYVIFIATGDVLHPWALLHRVEEMLRAQADFGFTQMQLQDRGSGRIHPHNGSYDMALWPQGMPPAGLLELSPMQALSLEAQCSAKIFRRAFVQDHGLRFTPGPRSDWALCLTAGMLAARTLYLHHAGVTVSLCNDGFERWRMRYGARTLNQSHKALLEAVEHALPEPVKARLPDGWQRRLFARALREQANFGVFSTRWKRFAMLLGAVTTSLRWGYGAPRPAGLDTSVTPELERLLDPATLVAIRLGMAGARGTSPLDRSESMQPFHAFDPRQNGMIRLRVNFHTAPYANIFFHAANRRRVLFHLSLRHVEGLAVCNDQGSDGQWRAEQICPVDLSAGHAVVTITFDRAGVRVSMDDREIFHFPARSLFNRTGFVDLDKIEGFTIEGTISTPIVLPFAPQMPLSLDSRLNIRVCNIGAADQLHVLPADIPLPLIPAPDGTATALLPGRLWRSAPDGILTLTLIQDTQRHTLTLTRAEMAAQIDTLLRLPLAASDATLSLHVLEHVRYGDMLGMLSAAACQRLAVIAAFYRVQDFVQATPGLMPAIAANTGLQMEIDSAVARLAQSQIAPLGLCPDPLAVVAGLSVSSAALQPLFLELTGFFCIGEQNFDGLHSLAQEKGVLPLNLPPHRWSLSAGLPYLLADARYKEVAASLRKLAAPGPEWLMTPAIGWTLRTALTRPDIPPDQLADIVVGFADFLRNGAPDYWGRAHCRELTRAAAALILHLHRLPSGQRASILSLCLEIYGLSPQFWENLEAVRDLPVDIARAQVAFRQLMHKQTNAADRNRALHVFEALGVLDAPRLRREMFGPAGLPDLRRIDISDLGQAQQADPTQLSRDILRHMAHPSSAPVSPAVADLATEALPVLYPETPCAPHFDIQQIAAQQAADLLAGRGDFAALTDNLTRLADAASHHIGMGLALALIDGLHEEDPDQVAALCDWLGAQMDRLSATWSRAPALCQPARRLSQRRARGQRLLPCAQAMLHRLDIPPNAQPATKPPEGSPLFDTIVIVFSCLPYLETRIPALRTGWLSLLEGLGVPYVVVVGNGDGTRRGDVVHLDAPDDYEGLPQKTLAAIKWVHDNTGFGHMLKIDDDCFLNAPLFFQSLSYAKFDYYGRRLHRVPGQMDRIWHQAKSSSSRGRLDLDKSPEPSEYADGGSAYTLSRTAMTAALDAAASPEGRQLIDVSFMEDKMLGDLLAMRGIYVAQEDYRIAIRRRTYGDAIAVPAWLNSFHPSTTAPFQLVHLDTHLDQADALQRLGAPGLWPRKIWPSYQDVKLGYQSNALELVSDEASVKRARQAEVAVVACMRNEMFMLPHFLAHYRKLGVSAFLIADNCSDDGTLEYLAAQPDVALFSVDTDYRLSHYGVAWQQAMMAAFRVGKWSLVADTDELLVWQENQTQTLSELLQTPDFATADAARIFMLDMYPQGPLEDADFTSGDPFAEAGFADRVPFLTNTLSRGPYSDQPCWTSALRHRLIPRSRQNLFVAQKLALLRYQPWMRLSAGLHFVGNVDLAPRELLFAHFKYNADFRRKAQTEVRRGQHFNDAEEYRKYLALASEGRSVIHDPDLSAPWSQVPFVKRRLGP